MSMRRGIYPCTDPERFDRGGPTLTTFFVVVFLVDEGREDPNTTKVGHHRPASETSFKWRFAGLPMMAQH